MRDALYQSLLTGPRAALHLKIAEEIERRAGNRLPEVVETLAHHFGQTDRADKAFAYLAMAGREELRVYSFDEAGSQFAARDRADRLEPGLRGRSGRSSRCFPVSALYSNCFVAMKLTMDNVVRFSAAAYSGGRQPEAIVI